MGKDVDFQILICLIKIWDPVSMEDLSETDNVKLISEVSEIEIDESYRKLISTAVVRFPRGTVIRRTIDKTNEKKAASSPYLEAHVDAAGVVETIREDVTSIATVNTFRIGQRIKIYLGYTTNPRIAQLAKTNSFKKNIFDDQDALNEYLGDADKNTYDINRYMNLMFDGFISSVSVDTPIELKCEGLTANLKNITCENFTIQPGQCAVKTFLGDEDGQHNMLEGTGLKLHPAMKNMKFDFGKYEIRDDFTVADVLIDWGKHGLCSQVVYYDGKPTLKIGRIFFSDADGSSVLNMDGSSSNPIDIRFDYHVAKNDLQLMSINKDFLAVEATAEDPDRPNKTYKIVIVKNMQYNSEDKESEPFRVVQETNMSRKAVKVHGQSSGGKKAGPNRTDLKLYHKISYIYPGGPTSRDNLLKEAIKYYEEYNANGIEGKLTLFGDLHLRTAQKVRLIDNRYPGKNGVYLVEEVHTTFGVNGYRQSISIPYCIKRGSEDNNEGNGATK